MDENRVSIRSIAELTPGYIMMENIGTYKELQEGSILDTNSIELIKSLGISHVSVIEPSESEWSRHETAKAVDQEISNKIEEIFSRETGTLRKPGSIHYQPIVVEDFPEDFRKEAGEILTQVKTSREDIVVIEGGEKISLKQINREIDKALKNFETILLNVFYEKNVDYTRLREIVNYFILLTGPKRESSFLLLGVAHTGANPIVRHAVNTCLLSLAIAIEMSKIMDGQLRHPDVRGDFRKLKICSYKIFTREELIKLGIAAILCDLFLMDAFPEIDKMTTLTARDLSKVHLHPSHAFSFLTERDFDFDIRKAILQHHERADGSGYPDGVEKRMFSKYALVLSFADHYELKTSRNIFERRMHPQKALMEILRTERNQFDDDVIFAFCKAASLFPVGSWVVLSDQTVGFVIRSNKNDLKKPVIKVAYSPEMKEVEPSRFVNLSESNLFIRDIVDVEAIRNMDGRYERFIFEEREYDRIRENLRAVLAIKDTAIRSEVRIENISPGGALISTDVGLTKGQHVLLDFEFESRFFRQAQAIVLWKNATDRGGFYCGLCFVNIAQEDYSRLQGLVMNSAQARV